MYICVHCITLIADWCTVYWTIMTGWADFTPLVLNYTVIHYLSTTHRFANRAYKKWNGQIGGDQPIQVHCKMKTRKYRLI